MSDHRMRTACWVAVIALLVIAMAVWLAFGPPASETRADNGAREQGRTDGKPGDSGSETRQNNGVKELGETHGKPVDSGFVFLDGRYIDAPYTVSRRGIEVLINGIVVRRAARWPLRDSSVSEDPGDPQGLTERSSMADLKVSRHALRKLRYLRQHFPPEIARQRMAEYYRKCPCVESVVPNPRCSEDLLVTLKDGRSALIYVAPFMPPPTKHDVRRTLERYRESLQQRLQKGDCYFFFSKRGDNSFGKDKVCKDLRAMVAILRSERSTEEKRALLERLGFLSHRISGHDSLVTSFQASQQLDRRIDALVAKSGVPPRTVDEIPVIPDAVTWELFNFRRSKERVENSLKTEQDPDARAKLGKRLDYLREEGERIRAKMESYEEIAKKSRGGR